MRTPLRLSLAAMVMSLTLGVAACGSGSSATPTTSPGATATAAAAATATAAGAPADVPIPDGVMTLPESPAPPLTGCDASLRPTGPLPAAGAMPAGSTMAKIQQRGYLIAGVDEDSYLFGYRNPSADPSAPPLVGFDIDFVQQVATAIFGAPGHVRYKVLTKAERLTALQQGSVDLLADILTVDCQRAQQADFSADYFDAGQRVLVNQASTVQSIADLAGKKVCAAAGTTSIQTLADPKYRVVPVSAVNWADCLVMLQQGQVDAISTTDLILLGIQSQDPYTKIVGPRFTYERHGLGFPKGKGDFIRFVNAVLEQMKANGTWTAIYTHWIGDRLGPVPAPPPAVYQ
ncbi:glutamate ABC transporter substrate-binding protein [Catenulispora sp. EB89]|uniref:glutamate ABC transporter substrate-binding protein n=1 Tax=Catenulispora sp. EB89 TaxID=3156257 RepID=UPI0035172675